MSVEVEAYLIISASNLLLVLSGALLTVATHHALMQWRLNRPQAQGKTP